MVEEAKGHAKIEGERIVVAAKSEIEQEVFRAKEALRARVAALAVQGAEKILAPGSRRQGARRAAERGRRGALTDYVPWRK